ncbi:hypothetical protein DL764_008310 [Monosporascus ibericus]|uniref:Invertebrate defensins family profile domain-containing protein n=1 Tax=Monosporascus ibericus TaxID=155417 RepID=A0A4Q4SXT9_9PEZI|nr:hypothetical protein DL764_008310 [Monosporascus ibericus]
MQFDLVFVVGLLGFFGLSEARVCQDREIIAYEDSHPYCTNRTVDCCVTPGGCGDASYGSCPGGEVCQCDD